MGVVKLYCDGSSKGNPGPGGYGCILRYISNDGKVSERELTCGYKQTTNNRMELMGLIAGLSELNRACKVEVYSDSKYLIDAFNQGWLEKWQANNWKRPTGKVKNVDLWKKILKLVEVHNMSFTWVKGHDGHPENERCDKLACDSSTSDNLIEDDGFSEKEI